MTFLDSSVLVDYLRGVDSVVRFVEQQDTLLTSTICVYEVLEGEVFRAGDTDVFGRRRDFGRVEAVAFDETIALEAARLQADLHADGDPLTPRDAMIAATARATDDLLAVSDDDFQVDPLTERLDVTNPRERD